MRKGFFTTYALITITRAGEHAVYFAIRATLRSDCSKKTGAASLTRCSIFKSTIATNENVVGSARVPNELLDGDRVREGVVARENVEVWLK
jgi:hypothetical protein